MSGEVNAGTENAEAAAEIGEIGAEAPETIETPPFEGLSGIRNESSSQKSAERVNEAVRARVLEQYGELMSPERKRALERYNASEKIAVIAPEEYNRTHKSGRGSDFRVVGHCEAEGRIVVKDIDPAMTRHISAHESMHLCAEKPAVSPENGVARRSGLFEWTGRFNERGECVSSSETGRGVNEGFTELYALRELERQGDTDARYAMTSYFEARGHAERLELAIGKERMERAYFGEEKDAFVQEFNRMCGDEAAWDGYAKDIDTIAYSGDAVAVAEANRRVNGKYIDILLYKQAEGRQSEHDEL
jgi:hypothetical protein